MVNKSIDTIKGSNKSIVTIKVTREELCRLIMACSYPAADQFHEKEYRKMWQKTHDKLMDQLDEFDRHVTEWEK